MNDCNVAIVQARMGSRRFPNKMMELLEGSPVIEWVLRRSICSKMVDKVVLATSEHHRDDVLADIASELGVEVFRGSEADVLGRYAAAAEVFRADTVIRICADRPLVAPEVIDCTVETFISDTPDLAFSHTPVPEARWPVGFGVEVFSSEMLAWLNGNVFDPSHREHVTLHLWDNRARYHLQAAPCPPEIDSGSRRAVLDVDWPKDLARLRNLCRGFDFTVTAAEIMARWRTSSGVHETA